jgi:hypothetical protein
LENVTLQDKELFAEIYQDFTTSVREMEDFITAYIRIVFMRRMKIQEALDLITR